MKVHNRIFIFFSIGFVLIFFGKISKVDLFHNYFKQIEDIEVRNSTEVSDIQWAGLPAQEVEESTGSQVSGGAGIFSEEIFTAFPLPLNTPVSSFIRDNVFVPSFPYLLSHSPLAP